MATSEHSGYIRHASTHYGDGYPVDAGIYQDCVANNVNHLLDQYGQVLVSTTQRTSNGIGPGALADTTYFYPMCAPFGPFILTLGPDGNPYPLVVRVAAKATAANSVTIRVVASSLDAARTSARSAAAGTNTVEVSTSSTTEAWLTPVSDVIDLTASDVSSMAQSRTVYEDDSGGAPQQRQCVVCYISVWVKTTNVAATGELFGLYVREYVGL